MNVKRKATVAGFSGVVAGFLGAICCLGAPIVLALGVGSGFVSAISPLRPLFGGIMIVFLAWGFYLTYSPGRSRRSNGGAARGHSSRLILWVAALLGILLWSLPFLMDFANSS